MFHMIAIVLILFVLATVAVLARARRPRSRAISVTPISHDEMPEGRPTVVPGEITRSMRPSTTPDESSAAARPTLPRGMHGLMVLALVALATGCAATTAVASVTSAIQTSMSVLKGARSILCTTRLDPLLGDPREGEPRYVPAQALGGDAGPSVPTPDATAPADTPTTQDGAGS